MHDASDSSFDSSPHPRRTNHSLSDISHLFLSSVRERQTQGAELPKRRPPGQHLESPASTGANLPMDKPDRAASSGHVSIDLTPEEFSRAFGGGEQTGSSQSLEPSQDPEVRIPPIAAILTGHLNGSSFDRAREYARHLAQRGLRIGMICVDAAEFRVMCFDCPPQGAQIIGQEAPISEYFDGREMAAALNELSWDLDRWLLVLPVPRTCEARKLLREVDHWVLLSTCDHDGMISAYRTLKGVSEMIQSAVRPRLTLALLDSPGNEQSDRIHRKLASVCEQFLRWPLESEPDVRDGANDGACDDGAHYADDRGEEDAADRVAEHLVLCSRTGHDKGQLAMAPQWNVVSEFLEHARLQRQPSIPIPGHLPTDQSVHELSEEVTEEESQDLSETLLTAETAMKFPQTNQSIRMPAMREKQPMPSAGGEKPMTQDMAAGDVIDLPDASEAAIVEAVLRSEPGALVECPVSPPNSDARLAVNRQRGLLLVAIARPGLTELKSIARAYAWVVENSSLIGMAMPQMAIDNRQAPRLRLLVDHADMSAGSLSGMLQSESISVQAYRKVRWGEKTGLLLEAA